MRPRPEADKYPGNRKNRQTVTRRKTGSILALQIPGRFSQLPERR
jgi:hypothetical protein